MWTASCVDEVGQGNTNAMKSFVLGWPIVNFVATFNCPGEKDKWRSLLQRYMNLDKEKDQPKSIPLKIFTEDLESCACAKTLTVTNSHTANEITKMSLAKLGITGSERDYQLWVISGKEAAPFPLIGHEYPYVIKMSHLRDSALLTESLKDCSTPSNLQEPFLMEQLPREMQCQFILKPRRLAAAQQLSDSGQKTSKRWSSLLSWACWWGSSTHLDDLPMSPTSPMPGQLFGVPLSDICEDDNLPKPVLDMLLFLNQNGPLTKGIFRLSGNVKSCRELKEKLNSGVEAHLGSESVFVIASVFKDFLRNIPGSLFSSALYAHWVSVTDQGNDEEKINTIQRLLEQLPRANIVLLKYLFGVLYNIEQHSSSNQMTAFNLAVCIAPSILWPPTSSSPEVENELTNKVNQLIQVFIENCCGIFGEEITSLWGEISVRCDHTENASDNTCYQLSDSSCDILENELNEDVDAPCSDFVKPFGQESRIVDSVLSLSEYDPDQGEMEGLLALSDFDLDHSKDQSLVMGIKGGKSGATNENTEKVLTPQLNISPSTSSSSLSSSGTSPSGSLVSPQDSAFYQISEHLVFTPTETASPIDCTFEAQRKQGELSSNFSSRSLVSGMPSPPLGQASRNPAYVNKDTGGWHSQMHGGTPHPISWFRRSVANLKNWSLKKKSKACRMEERNISSLTGPPEPLPHVSDVPEDSSLQENVEFMPLRAATGLGSVQGAQWCGSYPCQDTEKHCSPPFSLVEDRLMLCMNSHKETEDGCPCTPGTLPWERSSPSSLTVDNTSSPDSGPTVVCSDEDRHSTTIRI